MGKETPASSPTQKIVTSVKPCVAPYCTECLHWKGFDFAKRKLAPCSHQTELFWPLRTFMGFSTIHQAPVLPSLLARTLALYFDGLSGFRVNGSPTQTFPWWLSTDTLNKLRSKFPFTWLFTSIKYLGVHLSHWTSDPLKLNYPPLVNQIKKKDLVKQNNLSLSWFSWLSTIKMNALPHVNYFLEVLPVLLPLSYL